MHGKLGNKEKWDFFLNQPTVAHELKKALLTQILSEDKGRKYFFLECYLTPQRPTYFESLHFKQIYGMRLKVNNLQKYAEKINKEMQAELIKQIEISHKEKYYYVDTTQEPFCKKENNFFERIINILTPALYESEYEENDPEPKQTLDYIESQKKQIANIKNGDDLRKTLVKLFNNDFSENYAGLNILLENGGLGSSEITINEFFKKFNTEYLPNIPLVTTQKNNFLNALEKYAKKQEEEIKQDTKDEKNKPKFTKEYAKMLLSVAKINYPKKYKKYKKKGRSEKEMLKLIVAELEGKSINLVKN